MHKNNNRSYIKTLNTARILWKLHTDCIGLVATRHGQKAVTMRPETEQGLVTEAYLSSCVLGLAFSPLSAANKRRWSGVQGFHKLCLTANTCILAFFPLIQTESDPNRGLYFVKMCSAHVTHHSKCEVVEEVVVALGRNLLVRGGRMDFHLKKKHSFQIGVWRQVHVSNSTGWCTWSTWTYKSAFYKDGLLWAAAAPQALVWKLPLTVGPSRDP